jgi:shikimate dehydrogenase
MIQLGLIGYPIEDSLSPKIHAAAFEACGLQGEYSLYPISPDDLPGLEHILARVRTGEIAGLNVTIPHKQNVIPLLDELTPIAKAIGAVNTIYMKAGELTGDNTDAPGFLADLQKFLTTEMLRDGDTKSALVLGAGGSARAIVYALANDVWKVTVAARRIGQAEMLFTQFPHPHSRLALIEYRATALRSLIPTLSLVVNTIPLGMSPNVDESPWPDNLIFPSNAAIYDLVYNPRKTKLVKDACAAGLSATTGLGMLIEQAALSFQIWTGCHPSRAVLWNSVEI